jgi:hypothetical protein
MNNIQRVRVTSYRDDVEARGVLANDRGSQPRWPEKAEGMETSKRARRRKLDTAKTDLKPPLAVLRRAGCPSRDGIRRA